MKQIPYFCILLVFSFFSCYQGEEKKQRKPDPVAYSRDLEQIVQSGELIVLTSPGATSYFMYGKEERGYQYELAKRFANYLGVEFKLKVVPDESMLPAMLLSGEGDIAAFRVPVTNELKKNLLYASSLAETNQVLVQAAGDSMITSLAELIGKEVHVLANTKYERRLRDLNNELGGGIIIKPVTDSLGVDELIDNVSLKNIRFTIADSDIALVNKTYLKNLDCSLSVSFPQHSGWAVSKHSPLLNQKASEWLSDDSRAYLLRTLNYNYFERNSYFTNKHIVLYNDHEISPYDILFKKYAPEIPWDWKLLASQAFYESNYNTRAVSPAGAIGLMQIMPLTARGLGTRGEQLSNPEDNVRTAVKYIKRLDKIFVDIRDDNERIKFILAGYNAGPGHVLDAMRLTEKNGYNKYVWDDNVDVYMRLMSIAEYYNDPDCRYGMCRGEDVSDYVRRIVLRYERFKSMRNIE